MTARPTPGLCRRDITGFGCPCGEPATHKVMITDGNPPAECEFHARERFAWCHDAALVEVKR